jgi:hypothetical protein
VKRLALLALSHLVAGIAGLAAGMYVLPILAALPAVPAAELERLAQQAEYRTRFDRNLEDSDWLHWGEGTVSVSRQAVSVIGRIAPGPNYKLYLSPEFVQTERDFHRVKAESALVGDVETFHNFVIPIPDSVDVSRFNTVVIWCESFSQFITAARYR